MADDLLLREIRRAESEVASVYSRIREAVYRTAWDAAHLHELERQLTEAKDRLERFRDELRRRRERLPDATAT